MDNNMNNNINNIENQQSQNNPDSNNTQNSNYNPNTGYNQQSQHNQMLNNNQQLLYNQMPNSNQNMYNNQMPNFNQQGYQNQYQNNGQQNPSFNVPNYNQTAYDVRKDKNSFLGVLALALSILGCTAIFGGIIALIDLLRKDGHKKSLSIAALVISCFWFFIGFNEFFENRKKIKDAEKESATVVERTFNESENETTMEATTEATTEKKKVVVKKAEKKQPRSGYGKSVEECVVSNFVFNIPDYYVKDEKSNDNYFIYNVNDCPSDAKMFIQIISKDEITKTDFNNNRKEYVKEILDIYDNKNMNFEIKTCLTSRINDVPAVTSKLNVKDLNGAGTGEIYLYLDEAAKQICYVMLVEYDSQLDYFTDFNKMAKNYTFNGTVIEPETTEATTEATTETTTETTTEGTSNKASGIRPEFKQMMDSYEAFYDEYISFIQKMNDNPTDMELLNSYYDLLSKELEWSNKIDALDENDMTDEEAAYYLEVTARISQKLINAGLSMGGN